MLDIDPDKLFDPYVSYEDCRPEFQKPFSYGDYLCATETHMFLRVDKSLLNADFATIDRDVSKIFPEANCCVSYTLRELEEAVDASMTGEEEIVVSPSIECDECDGTGFVEWEYISRHGHTYHDELQCPCCDGRGTFREKVKRKTGKKAANDGDCIGIGGAAIYTGYLAQMCETMRLIGSNHAELIAMKGHIYRFRLLSGVELVICATVQEPNYRLKI